MRREFAQWIEAVGSADPRLLFLTGDLGFDALERVQEKLGPRFINAGVSEQNMISMAAGLAQQGLNPFCYSIAPFAVFRAYEQIRIDVALHGLNVKIVGNGGGYGYGIMGATHHALEDLAVLSALPNFRCVVPLCNADVPAACASLVAEPGPAYLRLGFGLWPAAAGPLGDFQPLRRIAGVPGKRCRLTVVGLGPVLLNALPFAADYPGLEVFAAGELPLADLAPVVESLRESQHLLVIEEHAPRGGLGEYLAAAVARTGTPFRFTHHHAAGYPGGLYGSQSYHQQASGLDTASLKDSIARILGS
jgi:transketolase